MKRNLVSFAVCALMVAAFAAPQAAQAEDKFLQTLNDPMAAFLESRAYAEKMGATAEFRKMEGVALDTKNNKLYIAMSEIGKTMSDSKGDINLPENKCGIVYGAKLDSNWNISMLTPDIVGGPYKKAKKMGPAEFKNACDIKNMANPDGLATDANGNVWVAEDTSNHINNALWRWDGKELKLFATVPTGAEITGLRITKTGKLFFNVQHPTAMAKYPYNRGCVVAVNGYNANTDDFTSLEMPQGDAILDTQVAKGSAQVLARVGHMIPNDPYGQRFGQVNAVDGAFMEMCNHPDGNMFLPITSDESVAYLYTNYECRPGAVGKIMIMQDGDKWNVVDGENVSFAKVNGTWNNCNASITPWNTGLSSEEYEPAATKEGWKKTVEDMSRYLGKQANPYDYGYPVELIPDGRGNSAITKVVKHYAMGRLSYEMSLVMPDGKTVYSGDDGTGVVLFKYVADKAGDLSAGTLYGAKVKQNADQSLSLTWIELGRSNNGDVFEAIQKVAIK